MARHILRIELSDEAKRSMETYCDRAGKIKFKAISKLVEWFSKQDDTVQAIIQGDYPESIETDVANIILRKIVKKNVA